MSTLTLVAGAVAVVLTLVFFFTMLGGGPLVAALVAGVVGIILGVVALRKEQAKGIAVTGLVLSIITAVLAAAIILFALIFVGAIPV
jgi:hypothetical protein